LHAPGGRPCFAAAAVAAANGGVAEACGAIGKKTGRCRQSEQHRAHDGAGAFRPTVQRSLQHRESVDRSAQETHSAGSLGELKPRFWNQGKKLPLRCFEEPKLRACPSGGSPHVGSRSRYAERNCKKTADLGRKGCAKVVASLLTFKKEEGLEGLVDLARDG